MSNLVIITSVISAFCAGTTATLAAILVERYAGSVGGVIASSPSTIIIFSVATAVTQDIGSSDFTTTLYMSAVGLFGDAIFLWLWRELPKSRLLIRYSGNKYLEAVLLTSLTIGFWMSYAIALIYALGPLINLGVPNRAIGAVFWFANVLFGLYTVWFQWIPPPKVKKVNRLVYIGRFMLGACSIGVAIGISSINVIAGGIGSMFPNTFLASMLTLYLVHGGELGISAIGGLMLGSVSSPFYVALFAELLPVIHRSMNTNAIAGSIAATVIICEIIAILVISIPAYGLVKFRGRKHVKEQLQSPSQSQSQTDTTSQYKPESSDEIDLTMAKTSTATMITNKLEEDSQGMVTGIVIENDKNENSGYDAKKTYGNAVEDTSLVN
jgi:hypothetical protein